MTSVLLVDDDEELAAMLREYLQREGFEATAVHDGEAGVAEALSGRYAIAVLDVMMPRMNGVEALRRIRAKSRMPVLMLTAKGDDIDRIVGLELGADDYVPKPCTPRELVARLRAIMRRVGGEEQGEGGEREFSVGPLAVPVNSTRRTIPSRSPRTMPPATRSTFRSSPRSCLEY
jgi:DNA-binding response OmpR family regulator